MDVTRNSPESAATVPSASNSRIRHGGGIAEVLATETTTASSAFIPRDWNANRALVGPPLVWALPLLQIPAVTTSAATARVSRMGLGVNLVIFSSFVGGDAQMDAK